MDNWVLMNPTGHKHLNAFYLDQYKRCIRCKSDKGPKAYCCQDYLLTLETQHPEGKDAIERKSFGEIDTKGAIVRDILLESEGAITDLSADQRCEWARLLLSLDARRPDNISKLKNEVSEFLREELNNDEKIQAAMAQEGLEYSPAEYAEKHLGSLKDKSLSLVQALVDNPTVGQVLINAHWHVIQLNDNAEQLMLSDRPLIRIKGYDSSGAVWAMPISPSKVFIAVNHPNNLQRLLSVSFRQFSKKLNVSSASNADKYVFDIQESNNSWLEKYMKYHNENFELAQ